MKDKLKLKISDVLYRAVWWARETRLAPEYSYSAKRIHVSKKYTQNGYDGHYISYELSNGVLIDADAALEDQQIFTTEQSAKEYAKQQVIIRLKEVQKIKTYGYREEIERLQKIIKSSENVNRTKRFTDAIRKVTNEE